MAAKLILCLDGTTISEHKLNKESVTIGRKPDNDIPIDNLAISGHHAQIITILNESFLEDLNSTNGTYVNGTLVKKHALGHGDIIAIGKHQLKYISDRSHPDHSSSQETEMIGPGASDSSKTETQTNQQSTNATPSTIIGNITAKLQVTGGANVGKELELTKALTTIGKPGTQVAAVTRRPQGFFVIHVEGGSEQSTPMVNGAHIGKQAHLLNHNDVIKVAGIELKFLITSTKR